MFTHAPVTHADSKWLAEKTIPFLQSQLVVLSTEWLPQLQSSATLRCAFVMTPVPRRVLRVVSVLWLYDELGQVDYDQGSCLS